MMDFNILPPLKHMSAVRAASYLFENPELKQLLEELQMKNLQSPRKGRIDSIELDHWEKIEKWAVKKLNNSLPPPLRSCVAKLIRPMHSTADEWLWDHYFLRNIFLQLLCKRFLTWRTDGTIDRTETALKIVRNEDIYLKLRFTMACIYFLEKEAWSLWDRVKETEFCQQLRNGKEEFGFSNMAVRFWVKIFEEGPPTHWDQMAEEFLRNYEMEYSLTRTRHSCFWNLLSPESRSVIRSLRLFNAHEDDLRLYLQKIDEVSLPALINLNPIKVLNLFLKWPYQPLFSTFTNRYLSYTSVQNFELMLKHVIEKTIMQSLDDFDYLTLFKDFWNSSSDAHKGFIRKNAELIKIVETILNHNADNASGSLLETLEEIYSYFRPFTLVRYCCRTGYC